MTYYLLRLWCFFFGHRRCEACMPDIWHCNRCWNAVWNRRVGDYYRKRDPRISTVDFWSQLP